MSRDYIYCNSSGATASVTKDGADLLDAETETHLAPCQTGTADNTFKLFGRDHVVLAGYLGVDDEAAVR